MLIGSYDSLLVLFSLLVAILATYTTLAVVDRALNAVGRGAGYWLAGGACTLGVGIWSMHFIGMLAFALPIDGMGYDLPITLVSLLVSIMASGLALWLVSCPDLSWPRLGAGALFMGGGLAGMHYAGMAAMQMQPGIVYNPWWVSLSLLIAVGGSGVTIWTYTRSQHVLAVHKHRLSLAILQGVTIVSMHYAGMAAADFPIGSFCGAGGSGVSADWLALTVIIATLAMLAIALIVAVLDQRMASRTAVLAGSLDKANQELAYLALHDNLTRLPNRLLLKDRLRQFMERSRREGHCFAVLFMDLDGFKSVNDTYGHHIGDMLLKAASDRITNTVRATDTVARVGGDEFVVLLDINEPADAGTLAGRLVAAIGESYEIEKHELQVSSSIGIAVYPLDGATEDDLLSHADAAMYHVKRQGRDDYCFFDASMSEDAHQQVQLQNDLRHAVQRGELVLHYQPKFAAPHGPVEGLEALARWQHPKRGLLGPDKFIPLSEKTGLIVAIGEWVLDEACRQVAAWRDEGRGQWTVAVNVSASQLGYKGLVSAVRTALARHGLAPGQLILELTESATMQDADGGEDVLRELQELGVGISIDDFGTGYSNLLRLKRLPAVELKIDRGFVQDLATFGAQGDVSIVEAIVALGRSLGLRIVAEGVETPEQQRILTSMGCDALQGYVFARPMSAGDLAAQPWFSAPA